MRRLNLFMVFCLILPAASAVHGEVYTEAHAGYDSDWGDKPYSEASYTSSGGGINYTSNAEVHDNSLTGFSEIEHVSYGSAFGGSRTTSRNTIPFRVISDGPVSFDWTLTGELKVVLEDPTSWIDGDSAYYWLTINDTVSDDSVSSSFTLTVREEDGVGSYIEQIDLLETYDFGEGSFSAGSIIDVTLDLKTSAWAGYSFFGPGSVISSDFSDSLTFDNLVNLEVVPEPTSFILLLLGGIGLQRLRRR